MSRVPSANETLLLGDHIALNLINTVMQIDHVMVDYWNTDEDVLEWLQLMQVLPNDTLPPKAPSGLLVTAKQLRELVRNLIQTRKESKTPDISKLNDYLMVGNSHLILELTTERTITLKRYYSTNTAKELLLPLAEAAADLIATGNFDLIKKCQSNHCLLWFYDLTRSHRRRWCSMALCGNRHKVAAFRQRETKHTK